MKLGLDLHGVIDADPEGFSKLSKTVMAAGGEVHVITGSMATEALHGHLKALGIEYTHLFSIASYHVSQGTAMHYDKNGDPWMDAEVWNRSKAEYCARVGIDLHVDDSDIYGQYFTTPYMRYWRPRYEKKQ